MTDHEPANFAIGNDICKKCKYVHPLGAPCIDPGKSLDDAFRKHTAMTDQTELDPDVLHRLTSVALTLENEPSSMPMNFHQLAHDIKAIIKAHKAPAPPVGDVEEQDFLTSEEAATLVDGVTISTIALRWYTGWQWGQPHTAREGNFAVQAFQIGMFRALQSDRAIMADLVKAASDQSSVVERLCCAIDSAFEDIGGESVLDVMKELGPANDAAKTAITAAQEHMGEKGT